MKKLLLAGLIAGLCSSQAIANQETYNQPQLGYYGGITYGGDDFFEVTFTDGSTQTLSAGGLLSLGASVRTQHTSQLVSKINAGYHFDSISATNGDASFSRVTVDALAGYKVSPEFTFYAGITYHLSPELDIDFSGVSGLPNGTAETDSTLGFVAEGAINVDKNTEMTLRLVSIDYDGVSGSHAGLYYNMYF